jgi:hypothetical protein
MLMEYRGGGVPSGRWFPRSYKQAERWLRLAADANPPLPEAAFALSLLNGIRGYTQRDPAEVRNRLLQAAEAGHPESCWLLGREVLRRNDDLGAAAWCLRAAEAGHLEAQQKLAQLAPEIVKPDAELLAAARAMLPLDMEFALRMEWAAHFALARHELLLLDPLAAEQGDFLLIDVRENFGKASRRLLRIHTPAQRDVLNRARLALPPLSILLPGEYQALRRRFTQLCGKLGVLQAA